MKMTNNGNFIGYEAPLMDVCAVLVEQGFSISGGSSVEQVGDRADEIEW